jgi:hypothetical protein
VGADFTFSKFPYFDMGDNAREDFRSAINSLDEDQLSEWEEWYGEPLDKEDLLEDIEQACGLCSRETATEYAFTENGQKYEVNMTGGMSWGDPPTEAYDVFNRAGFFDDIYNLAVAYSVDYIKMYQ